MKTRNRGGLCRFGFALLVLLFAAAAVAPAMVVAAPADFKEALPANTLLYAGMADYPGFVEKFKATPYHDLFSEPEILSFIDHIVARAGQGMAELQEAYDRIGVTPADLDQMLAGQVGLALGELSVADKKVDLLAFADVTGRRENAQMVVDKLLAALQEQFDNETIVQTEDTFRGHTIHRIAPPDQEGDAALHYMLSDELLLVAIGGRTMMEKMLVMQGDSSLPSLAASETFRRVMGPLGVQADTLFYANLAELMEQIPASAPSAPGPMGMPQPDARQILDVVGLLDVQAAAVTSAMLDDGVQSRGMVLLPAPRRGLLKAFVPDAVDLTPPPYVTKDASTFAVGYCNVQVLFQEILNAFQTLAPQMHQMLQMQLNNPQMPVNIQQDIIGTLGSRWIVYQPAEAITANPPRMNNRATIVELKNPDALKRAVQTLMAMAGPNITTAQHEGQTIYQAPAQPAMSPDMPGTRQTFTFADNSLVIATNLALAKKIISDSRSGNSGFLNNPDYRRISDHALDGAQMLAYRDTRRSAKGQWEMAANMLAMTSGLTLPSWETIQKYQSVSLTTGKWNSEGFLFQGWQTYPDIAN